LVERRLSALTAWLEGHTSRSPAALAEQVTAYALAAAQDAGEPVATPLVLAEGARRALVRALSQPGDRSAALDLLAGDALVTLALLAQAEAAPDALGEFARGLLRPERLVP
jgi:hypothetical protein